MSETPEDVRFRIGGGKTIYSLAALDELSLKDLLALRGQLADLGVPETWNDIVAASDEMTRMDDPDEHELSLLVFAVTIWAARRSAGDELTFGDAIDFPLSSITYLAVPQDKRPKARKAPAKKSTRTSARAASSPAPSV